jgi:hypothetical protein
MKIRVLMMLAVFSCLLLVFGSASWAGGGTGHRQIRQAKRIAHGVRNGQITDREFVHLNREQWRIQQYKHRALADGYMTSRERHKLHRMQKRASAHIYRSKHNHASHRACTPIRKRLSFWRKPVYDGPYSSHTFLEPTWAFGWSVGWQ